MMVSTVSMVSMYSLTISLYRIYIISGYRVIECPYKVWTQWTRRCHYE